MKTDSNQSELKTSAERAAEREFPQPEKFPSDLSAAVKLMQKLTGEVAAARSKATRKNSGEIQDPVLTAKVARLKSIKKHVHGLQQGLPVVTTTANQLACAPGLRVSSVHSARLRTFCAANPWFQTQVLDRIARLESQTANQPIR